MLTIMELRDNRIDFDKYNTLKNVVNQSYDHNTIFNWVFALGICVTFPLIKKKYLICFLFILVFVVSRLLSIFSVSLWHVTSLFCIVYLYMWISVSIWLSVRLPICLCVSLCLFGLSVCFSTCLSLFSCVDTCHSLTTYLYHRLSVFSARNICLLVCPSVCMYLLCYSVRLLL